MSNPVMDTATAEAFLSYKLLCHMNEPFTLSHLTSILFHITQMSANIPLPVTSAIRAVAFILKKHSACEIMKATAKQLASDLVLQLTAQLKDSISHHVNELQATTECIATSAQQINSTLAPTVEAAERLHKLLKDECEEKEDDARIAADRIEEAMNDLQSSVDNYCTSLKSLTPSLTTMDSTFSDTFITLLLAATRVFAASPFFFSPKFQLHRCNNEY